MIAIQTKFLPVTNSRGSRIKAWTSTGFSVTIPYPHEESYELAHFEAVKALVDKHNLDWDLSDMRWGGTESGYVFCFAGSIVESRKVKTVYTGEACGCRPGNQRDNCPTCEGTGKKVDFAAMRSR